MKDLEDKEAVQAKKMKNYIVNIKPPQKVIYITRSNRYLYGLLPIREEAFYALLMYSGGYRIEELDERRFKTNEFINPRDG